MIWVYDNNNLFNSFSAESEHYICGISIYNILIETPHDVSKFYLLEIVDRGSETIASGWIINYKTRRFMV